MIVLKNPVDGRRHEMDDDAINELASALEYSRKQGYNTVIFRAMRLDTETAKKIITDSI